ncbi:MAG TPA: ABC transporter permease [Bacteroidales bacterium]|nr:ABC transporter permease [Bacteroidales bacterium]
MIKNYLNIALRVIKRNWSFTLINVGGIAIGLATYVLIMLWVNDELNYDKFNVNYSNLYRIVEDQYYGGNEIFPVAVTPVPLAQALKEQYPEVKKACRYTYRWYTVRQGDKVIDEPFSIVDPDFLDMYSVEIIKGNKQLALQNTHSVILTDELASKYFGSDDPIGKTINIDKKEFIVSAVMKKFPKNSHFEVNSLIPFLYLKNKEFGTDFLWGNNSYWTYVLLDPQTDLAGFNRKIKDVINVNTKGGVRTDIYAQPIGDIHLHCSGKFTAEIGTQGDIKYVNALRLIAIFILLIACINFMNLSTAQSAKRAKEVGMKKITGCGKGRLILQFLSESLILVIIADIIAMVIVESLLPGFNNLTEKHLDINYFSFEHLKSTLGIVLITGLIAGSYPAFFLSSFDPLKVLKGKFHTGKGAVMFRQILVTVQFSISIILIIGTLVVGRQLKYIQDKKLGYDQENLVYFYFNDDFRTHLEAFKDDLRSQAGVVSMSISDQVPTSIGHSSYGMKWEGKNTSEDFLIHHVKVDEDFQNTFKISMAEGRFFSKEMRNDSSSVILNETAARLINPKGAVTGMVIEFWGKRLNVVGVVKDFNFKSVHRKIEPLLMMLLPEDCTCAFVRIKADEREKALRHLENTYKKYASDQPYNVRFLDESLQNLYRSEKRISVIIKYFSVLAIFISCLGLFGLSLYTAELKTKEIGIRKTLGATTISLLALFLRQYFRWILAATLIAIPVSWYTMQMWLDNFAYRISLGPFECIVAAMSAFAIAMITVGYHAYKTANKDPVSSLRYE